MKNARWSRREKPIRITEVDVVELHLHGYDVGLYVGPDEPAVPVIEAHATGRFPISSHGWGEGGPGYEALTYLT